MNNNQFGMNSTNNQMNSNNFNQNGSFNQPEQPTNFGQNQNNQPNNFIQSPNQNMNTFNEQSTSNNKSKNKNKIILIIGVIVIVVIIGVILLFSGIFNGNNKNDLTFVSNAKSYVAAAEALVDSDGVSSLFGSSEKKYAPTCNSNNDEINIKIIDIITENYGTLDFAGPYGTYYDVNNSYVKVKAIYSEGLCNYEYYIYLTDGTYSIGTPNNPILIDNVTTKSIKK